MKSKFRRIAIMLLTLTCACSCMLTSCVTVPDSESSDPTPNSNPNPNPNPNPEPDPEPEPEPEPEIDLDSLNDFQRYVSNTSVATGHNYALTSVTPTTKTFRGVFMVQEHGEFPYRLYFANAIDSTDADGSIAYRGMPTREYTILSAYMGISKSHIVRGELESKTQVLFDGEESLTVQAGARVWSDMLTLDVPENYYLVFEWTVNYTLIPAIRTGGTFYAYASSGGSFTSVTDVPMPDLIGAQRLPALRVGFIGDSITQGAHSGEPTKSGYPYWVSKVADGLGEDVSVWNLGLGYARADDLVNSPSWMFKARQCDVIGICFGVNDINSGVYRKQNVQRTAAELVADIASVAETLSGAGIRVIIFATPPYTYSNAEKIQVWREAVVGLRELAETEGYDFFDFATPLGTPESPETPAYGGHPNGDGGTAVAEAFLASGLIDVRRSRAR